MEVAVVGGSGFIGTWLVDELERRGHKTLIFDRALPTRSRDRARFRQGDIRDRQRLTDALRGVDAIFHLAAEHRDDVRPVSRYREVNVQGTTNLVRAAEANGIRRIVFTSTVAVYPVGNGPVSEATPPDPGTPYGQSKLQAERVLQDWADAEGDRRLVVVRPTAVFGEGNRGNVRVLMEQVRSRRFLLVGNGRNRKSMCYVGNLVPFLAQALNYEGDRRVFNYVDGPDLTMHELVGLLRRELGLSGRPLPRVPYVLGLAGGYAFDLASWVSGRRFPFSSARVRKFCSETRFQAKALEERGYRAPYELEDGIRRMLHQ